MRYGEISRDWADGFYTFLLDAGGVRELQIKCGNVGPMVILQRLAASTFFLDDICEIVRIALIGGGTKPVEALRLVRRYVEQRPLLENVQLCIDILSPVLVAPEGDEPKKADAEAATMTPQSDFPKSMERERFSDTPQPKSMN